MCDTSLFGGGTFGGKPVWKGGGWAISGGGGGIQFCGRSGPVSGFFSIFWKIFIKGTLKP